MQRVISVLITLFVGICLDDSISTTISIGINYGIIKSQNLNFLCRNLISQRLFTFLLLCLIVTIDASGNVVNGIGAKTHYLTVKFYKILLRSEE